jgi:hypothetical protein
MDPAIPVGMSQDEAAARAVAAFLAEPPSRHDDVERIEVVELRSGNGPVTTVAGVLMEWRQGTGQFGLLMPIDRLAYQAGGLDGVAFYLRLAVREPHGGAADGRRVWFTDLPSGAY